MFKCSVVGGGCVAVQARVEGGSIVSGQGVWTSLVLSLWPNGSSNADTKGCSPFLETQLQMEMIFWSICGVSVCWGNNLHLAYLLTFQQSLHQAQLEYRAVVLLISRLFSLFSGTFCLTRPQYFPRVDLIPDVLCCACHCTAHLPGSSMLVPVHQPCHSLFHAAAIPLIQQPARLHHSIHTTVCLRLTISPSISLHPFTKTFHQSILFTFIDFVCLLKNLTITVCSWC